MRKLPWIPLTILLGALAPAVGASAFSSLIVLGDSLSDTGNLCHAFFGFPSPPYASGRCSNGPVWIEGVASGLGLPLAPRGFASTPAGNNYATGGATTADLLNLQAPAVGSDFAGALDPTGLVAIWAGGNDFGSGSITAADAAANVAAVIQQGIAGGAENFLVPNLFDLALTPAIQGTAGAAAAHQFTVDYNAALDAHLAGIGGATFYRPDIFGLFESIVADPTSFGFTDVTTACFDSGVACAQPDDHLWWDVFSHPTASTHALVAAEALTSVPEPTTFSLVAAGLALLAAAASRADRNAS